MVNKIVPHHRLEQNNNVITIIKKGALLQRQLFFSALIIILIVAISWSVLKKSPDAFSRPLDATVVIFVSFFAAIAIAYIYLRFKRFLRVISNYRIEKKDELIINNKIAFPENIPEPIYIVIQEVHAWKGVGESFTVGLLKGKKFPGLCYGLKKLNAEEVAQFIAETIGYKVVYKEGVLFPLLKLH